MLIGEHERNDIMKIKKQAGAILAGIMATASLFLASCTDADGDGRVPMNDTDNKNIVDDVKKMADDAADRIDRAIPENSINKPSPDSANINT